MSVPLGDRPHRRRVVRTLGVAFETRIPPITAVKTDGDDIVFVMPVSAAGEAVHINPVDEFVVDELGYGHHNLGSKMAMKIVSGMLNHGFSCGVDFSR